MTTTYNVYISDPSITDHGGHLIINYFTSKLEPNLIHEFTLDY